MNLSDNYAHMLIKITKDEEMYDTVYWMFAKLAVCIAPG
jgi:hypothetical protein